MHTDAQSGTELFDEAECARNHIWRSRREIVQKVVVVFAKTRRFPARTPAFETLAARACCPRRAANEPQEKDGPRGHLSHASANFFHGRRSGTPRAHSWPRSDAPQCLFGYGRTNTEERRSGGPGVRKNRIRTRGVP